MVYIIFLKVKNVFKNIIVFSLYIFKIDSKIFLKASQKTSWENLILITLTMGKYFDFTHFKKVLFFPVIPYEYKMPRRVLIFTRNLYCELSHLFVIIVTQGWCRNLVLGVRNKPPRLSGLESGSRVCVIISAAHSVQSSVSREHLNAEYCHSNQRLLRRTFNNEHLFQLF